MPCFNSRQRQKIFILYTVSKEHSDRCRDSFPGFELLEREQEVFSSLQIRGSLWDPPSLLSRRYQIFNLERGSSCLIMKATSVEVKNIVTCYGWVV
jgi:hypothetical protein